MPATILGLPLFRGLDKEGRLPWQEGNAAIQEAMLNILLTSPGTRIQRPEFGAGLLDYLHHPNNETTRAMLADTARQALRRWEPRVDIEEVEVRPDETHLSQVLLSVRYRLKQTAVVRTFELALLLSPPQP